MNLASVSFDEMIEGEKPEGSHLPLLWSEDGRADGDTHYPRGFATHWSEQTTREAQGVNPYTEFEKLAEAQATPTGPKST